MPAGVRAFPVNYWDGLTPDEAAEFFDRVTQVREALRRPDATALDQEQEAFELRTFGVDDR